MPTQLYKHALEPGDYPTSSGIIRVTEQDVQDVYETCIQQLAEGQDIGLIYEHAADESALPARTQDEKDAMRENPYWARSRVNKAIKSGNKLILGLEVEDDNFAKSLLKAGDKARVSPQYGKFQVGGKSVNRALHHLALTHHPVQKKLQSFTDKPVMSLSDITGKDDKDFFRLSDCPASDSEDVGDLGFFESDKNQEIDVGDTQSLSDSKPPTDKNKSVKPSDKMKNQKASSSSSEKNAKPNDKFGASAYQSEEDDSEDSGDEFTSQEEEDGHEEQPNDVLMPSMPLPDEEKVLKGYGIALDNDSVLKGKPFVIQAILSTIADAFADMSYQTPVKTTIPMSETPKTPAPEVKAPTNEEFVALSNKANLMEETIRHLVGEVETSRKSNYENRIEACVKTGRCTPEKAETLKALSGAYKFSYSDAQTELDIRLSEIESLKEGAVVKLSNETQNHTASLMPDTPITSAHDNATQEQINKLFEEMGLAPINQSMGF